MNRDQAIEMVAAFKATGLFTKVVVEHFGFISRITEENSVDGKWEILLWSVNAQTGNHNVEKVCDYTADPKAIAVIARVAAKKATKKDQAAYARMEAERPVDAE